MDLSRFIKCSAGMLLLMLQLSFSCHAQQLDPPAGRTILTVTGAIGVDNQPTAESRVTASETDTTQAPSVRFDLEMIETLGLTSIATKTPWTTGVVEFEGVLLRDLLDLVKAQGSSVLAAALDDYVVEIPLEDFLEHDVIVATRIKGRPMKVRENGPLWIIYPWSDSAKLRRPTYYSRSIWQLKSLAVQP